MATALVLAALACSAPAWGAESAAGDAFEQLKLLAGEWEADLPGFGRLTTSIRLVSNGRAVEETIGTATDNEVSVYTRDADRVLLTHFCAMTPDGHQVRLETPRVHGTPRRLEFAFRSAVNLHSIAAPHMRRLVMTFGDRDHFSETWIKTEDGKDTVFEMHYSRH